MNKLSYKFSHASTDIYFSGSFSYLKNLAKPLSTVLITDEHVYAAHKLKFKDWNTIVIKAGEEYKIQATADGIIDQLIAGRANRETQLVGVGGGMITDITGYVASVFMRGIKFGFVPSSILAMVDAAIGGKNGVDVGIYKNLVGVIRQPSFILYDTRLLKSLPLEEWENGFAEIIKHACIADAKMFSQLEKNDIASYQSNNKRLEDLIKQNATIKLKMVQRDEFEKGPRKILNFGHTLGHALENQYELSHGQAISIGMTFASHVSEILTRFNETGRLTELLARYGLPTYAAFNAKKAWQALVMDKKTSQKEISFVLLEKIGKAITKTIPLRQLEKILTHYQ